LNVTETVTTVIAPTLGLPVDSLTVTPRPPLEIQSNRLFDVRVGSRHLIAKEYLQRGELDSAPLREYQALQVLAPLDIAPQPLFYESSLGPLVVYEYLPGQMWDRQRPSPSNLSRLAETWLKIQALPVNWLARGTERSLEEVEGGFFSQFQIYREWTTVEFSPGNRAADLCLELLANHRAIFRELGDYELALCFCRADPRFANVIQRPDGRLGLVDWEDSGLRDPARELADILTHPNQEDLLEWSAWRTFSEPYLAAHRKDDSTIDRRLHLYLAIFPFFWLSSILKRGLRWAAEGTQRVKRINELPINLRLRRYLARALAWPRIDFQDALDKIQDVSFLPDGCP
jgi:thiamine kinase-like enzyme